MNIALEQTEEHVNGTVTNRYGDTFIRGNNGAQRCITWASLTTLSYFPSALHICCGGFLTVLGEQTQVSLSAMQRGENQIP